MIIFCMVAGAFGGCAAGIGLWPIFPQPKNFKIQMVLTAIAIILFVIIIRKLH